MHFVVSHELTHSLGCLDTHRQLRVHDAVHHATESRLETLARLPLHAGTVECMDQRTCAQTQKWLRALEHRQHMLYKKRIKHVLHIFVVHHRLAYRHTHAKRPVKLPGRALGRIRIQNVRDERQRRLEHGLGAARDGHIQKHARGT